MGTGNTGCTTHARWIAVLRILVGILFVHAGWPKLIMLFSNPAYVGGMLEKMAKAAWPPVYAHFLTNFAVPHAQLFGALVALGEVAVGIGLILGLLTRVSAFFGAVMNINYLFAIYKISPGFLSSNNFWFTVLHIVFIGTAAGRAWGLDALLMPRLPKWLRWLG